MPNFVTQLSNGWGPVTIGIAYIIYQMGIKKGSELIFISRINKDGKGVTLLYEKESESLEKYEYRVEPLSMSQETYIAKI